MHELLYSIASKKACWRCKGAVQTDWHMAPKYSKRDWRADDCVFELLSRFFDATPIGLHGTDESRTTLKVLLGHGLYHFREHLIG